MSWVLKYRSSEIGGMESKSIPPSAKYKERPDTQASENGFNAPTRPISREIKTSSSIVRSEKHRYYRDMNKLKSTEEDKIEAKIDKNLLTPASFVTKSRTIIPTEFQLGKSPSTQEFLSSNKKKEDVFDKIGFSSPNSGNKKESQNFLQRQLALSRQSKAQSTTSFNFHNPLMKAMKQTFTSKLKIQPRKSSDAFLPERFLQISQKPQYQNYIKKHTMGELYRSHDPNEIKDLTKNMFTLYRIKEAEKAKRAFDFRTRFSLVNKYAEKLQNNQEVEFCKEILGHMEKVKSETHIIPFSIASINADNGLKIKVPTSYTEEIQTESIDTAKKMVGHFKKRAQQLGFYNERISKETKQIRKQRIAATLKNAIDHLKSMNYQKEGELSEGQKELKEDLFYHVKQNRLIQVMEIISEEPILINLMDRNKLTILHWAVKRNYLTLVEYLLKQGAKRDAQDILGRTPLHFASQLNFFEMTKVLLKYKVNLNLKNKKGLTPLEVSGSDDITNIISKAKRFEVIQKMSFKPMRSLQEAEKKLFRAYGEESSDG